MEALQPLVLAKALWRRKLWVLLPALAGASLALLVIRNIEPRYSATALILVEPQQVPKGFVRDTVTSAAYDRIHLIQQQVKQDEILEQLVRELHLYPELVDAGLTSEAIATARESIGFERNRKMRTVDVTFSGTDQDKVALAANRIADLIIEENTKLRLRGSEGTTAFVEAQITDAQRLLREKREGIAALKKRWHGRLSEQRETNQKAMEELERRLNAVEDGIENADTRRLLLQRADGTRRNVRAAQATPRGRSKLDQLRGELQALRIRFTDKHPDVLRLEREIAALEEAEITSVPEPRVEEEELEENDPVLTAELEALDQELDRLRSSREQLLKQISVYRFRLEGVPAVEAELATLEGERRNLENYYSSLLKKELEASMAVALEKRQQSEQFIVLERAKRPEVPYAPNLMFFLMVGIGVGGGIGVGLTLVLQQSDRTFYDIESLKEAFPGVALLSVVPDLSKHPGPAYPRQEKHRRRKSA